MTERQKGASTDPASADLPGRSGQREEKTLGAGNEAAAGVHALQPGAPAGPPTSDPSTEAQAETGRGDDAAGTDRSGSEPLVRRREHVPSYGGLGGEPRTSSDKREPADPEGDG
jgi:hypothetical protein